MFNFIGSRTLVKVAPGVNENDDLEPVLAPMTNGTYSGACPADGCAPWQECL